MGYIDKDPKRLNREDEWVCKRDDLINQARNLSPDDFSRRKNLRERYLYMLQTRRLEVTTSERRLDEWERERFMSRGEISEVERLESPGSFNLEVAKGLNGLRVEKENLRRTGNWQTILDITSTNDMFGFPTTDGLTDEQIRALKFLQK